VLQRSVRRAIKNQSPDSKAVPVEAMIWNRPVVGFYHNLHDYAIAQKSVMWNHEEK
jgi:hypothetical protein